MKAGGAKGPGTVRTVPAWIKVLVALHVFATLVWALPNPPSEVARGKVQPKATLWLLYWNAKYLKVLAPVRAYVLTTGTWQYWDMFAPEPASTDYYCEAEIEYRDGARRPASYPRMADLPIPLKYAKERYRKFYERAGDPTPPSPRFWPPFAQTLALHAYRDKDNPPVVVRLTQRSRNVAPPGERQETGYKATFYFAYAVDQKRLRQEAGER